MSEPDDPARREPPEFVAVTPRGVAAEPPSTRGPEQSAEREPQTEREPEAEGDPEGDGEPPIVHEMPDSEAAAAETPGTSHEEADDGAAADEPAPEPVASPGAEPAAAHAPIAPAQPDPQPVPVRVAAEGLAEALAGIGTPGMGGIRRSGGMDSVAVATAICVVLALAAGALLAITAHSTSHRRAVAAARVAALAAAKRETARALTYNYQTLDQDFARAEAGMSRKFRADYAKTAATSVVPLAQKTHAVTTGTVVAGGVISAGTDRAKILVFADQTVENKLLNATSRLDRSVIEVFMVKQGGRWVIDDLQPF